MCKKHALMKKILQYFFIVKFIDCSSSIKRAAKTCSSEFQAKSILECYEHPYTQLKTARDY